MRRTFFGSHWAITAVAVATLSASATVMGADKIPVISARSYVSGIATVVVTGAMQFNKNIPINTQASYSDGEMTWLQFGVSGSEAPHALVTISPYEVGLTIGEGRRIATAGAEDCTGDIVVAERMVVAEYNCPDITSHDPKVTELGKATFEIKLTAGS